MCVAVYLERGWDFGLMPKFAEAAFSWLEMEHMLLDQTVKKKDKQAPLK